MLLQNKNKLTPEQRAWARQVLGRIGASDRARFYTNLFDEIEGQFVVCHNGLAMLRVRGSSECFGFIDASQAASLPEIGARVRIAERGASITIRSRHDIVLTPRGPLHHSFAYSRNVELIEEACRRGANLTAPAFIDDEHAMTASQVLAAMRGRESRVSVFADYSAPVGRWIVRSSYYEWMRFDAPSPDEIVRDLNARRQADRERAALNRALRGGRASKAAPRQATLQATARRDMAL